MDFNYYFGPDKTPFVFREDGLIDDASIKPFHGIISLGLRNKLIEKNMSNEVWHRNGHLLEKGDVDSSLKTQELLVLKEFASLCKVLSFSQSVSCIRLYLERHLEISALENISYCDIWNIKEGHISSVWKINIVPNSEAETFILNVARDNVASEKLLISSGKMRVIGDKFPTLHLARVFDIDTLTDTLLPFPVVISRTEWIENSFEIHSRKSKASNTSELLLVERFLTDKDNPARITSVLGKLFTTNEVNQIENEITTFLTKAATCIPEKPEININNGDVVWDGSKAVVVAIA